MTDLEKQTEDSNRLFDIVMNSDMTKKEAETYMMMCIMDMSISRAGISHASKRIATYFEGK